MISIDKVETLEGLTVYGDANSLSTYYVLPNQPRFRMDDNGFPVFKFLKYRFPIDRQDGKKGGGYVFFDVEFTAPEDKLQVIKDALQQRVNQTYSRMNLTPPPVKIGQLTYLKGTAGMLLSDSSGALIQKANSTGAPSLFGKNVSAFNMELTPEGATLFEQALQGKGGVVQVFYDLTTWAKLPPIRVWGQFKAEKFYSFYQSIDIDEDIWGSDEEYRETVREQMRDSESMTFNFEWGALTDEKVRSQIRDWAQRAVEDAAERKMVEAIVPVSEEGRKRPEGIDEDVVRDIQNHKIASFTLNYTEKLPIEWYIKPQGTLPNITSLKGPDGKPIVWSDYAATIDLDDPFFKQLNVSIQANADFQKLPIYSIEVHTDYQSGNTRQIGEYSLKSPNDVGKFASYIEKNVWNYKYWYEVNYKGADKSFKSQVYETDEKILTINVADMGLLTIDVLPGDLNFEQVSQVQGTIQYEDSSHGVDLIEEQFTLDKTNKEFRMVKLIFQPRRNAYRYRLKYFMENGREFTVDWKEGRSQQLFIGDPFTATKTIGLRAMGNLDTEIDTIFVDLKYFDDDNDYTQTKTVALNKGTPFFDWDFPVIDESKGKVVYAGNIRFKSGTVEEIKETESTKDTILVGKKVEDVLEVQVITDLLDFSTIKLVKVSLRYEDPANNIADNKDLIFKQGATGPGTWKVELKNKSQNQYKWQASYFLTDGSNKKTEWVTTGEETIILELPA